MNVPTAQKPKLIDALALKYNMDPAAFYATIKATVMPNASTEQIASFLMVAHEFDLSPILKQIHAFPSKGGGITPIISIDGWCALVNRHEAYDGVEFEDHIDTDSGKVYAITCTLHRKDRNHPTVITEYLDENFRATDPWKTSPKRMLRHRAFIQAARLGLGLSAAFDEGHHLETPVEVDLEPIRQQVAPPRRVPPPAPGKAYEKMSAERAKADPDLYGKPKAEVAHDPETGEIFDPEAFLTELDGALHTAKTKEQLETIWADYEVQVTLVGHDDHKARADDLAIWHMERIKKG